MKLSDWARKQGINYQTAYRMFRNGTLPRRYEQLPTGTIIVHDDEIEQDTVVLYARVSSNDQKEDLERQMSRLRDYAAANGFTISQEISEIGSALNGKRKKLLNLLSDQKVSMIIVEHRDRMTRFGFEMIAAALSASGRKIIVINDSEYKDDLTQDMIDLVTSMCARIYGKRSAKNRARRALEAMKEE
jgi:putative resolvase